MFMGKKIERVFSTIFHQNVILGAHLQNPLQLILQHAGNKVKNNDPAEKQNLFL